MKVEKDDGGVSSHQLRLMVGVAGGVVIGCKSYSDT